MCLRRENGNLGSYAAVALAGLPARNPEQTLLRRVLENASVANI